MKHKTQTAWAVVGFRGWINHGSIRYSRRAAIADMVAEWRKYSSAVKYADLTDAQLWRVIKRRRNYTVRRIALKVVR